MIAIIDYKAGNTASIQNALERLGVESIITSNIEEIEKADGVIFPGQGRAGQAMDNLRKMGIDKIIPKITKPFLGICVGMQLLSEYSEEDETKCLSVLPGKCVKFSPELKTPQIGWNQVKFAKISALTEGIEDNSCFYFANSYYFDVDKKYIIGTTNYGIDFPSIVEKDNYYAIQFHPEKSGSVGAKLLNNFCKLC